MVPIEARYVEPMPGNLFNSEKFSALVQAIKNGEAPIVAPGYAHLNIVDRSDVSESQEYADDIAIMSCGAEPYQRSDIGALTAQVRDGNHRSFAPLVTGAPFTWIRISDSTKDDIFNPTASTKSYADRLYREIRRAQKKHDAPLLKRPRKKARPWWQTP